MRQKSAHRRRGQSLNNMSVNLKNAQKTREDLKMIAKKDKVVDQDRERAFKKQEEDLAVMS